MVSLLSPSTILILGTGSALSMLLYDLYWPCWNARDAPTAAFGHESSYAMSIMNPQHQKVFQHKLTLKISTAHVRSGITDDEVLALFTKGFFGGWVFTPERWLLSFTRLSLGDFEGLNVASELGCPYAQEIWETSSLSPKAIAPLGSLLFGNFFLADYRSATAQPQDVRNWEYSRGSPQAPTLAEFVAGGSEVFQLVSSHRFQVSQEEGGDIFTVTFSHVSCNSRTGRQFSRPFQWLHLVYARLLFSDGIREVMKG
ncbi:hypothetical protein VM1G_12067 [Cytospora mali]|uniref:Uncharacterized protein n=1 Tax=Cytospora mali TaxID=578113 RepID=A0A194VK04_CYTMA|nr:hypothetical protein VM1G_12067 [Valsa mali]